MNKRIFIIIFLFFSKMSFGQDVAFTQFLSNPIYLNPALTGQYNGNYRISTSYRSQWFGALDNPYQTFSFSGDLKFKMGRERKPDIFAFGMLFLTDQTKIFDLNTNQLSFSGSYIKYLGTDADQYLSGGVSIGLVQKAINYGNISFQDQWNAINGYTLATGENLPTNNFAIADISLGLNYSFLSNEDLRVNLGASYAHLNSPNQSFYGQSATTNPNVVSKSALDSKLTLYGSADWRFSKTMKIQPRAMYVKQDQHNQLALGSNVRLAISPELRQYLHVGAMTRVNNGYDGFDISTIMLTAGIELKDTIIGISYDYNVSDIFNERAGLNTFEISLQYFGEAEEEAHTCPKF